MNIYDVPELQQYLNPQVDQQSTELVDPTMLLPQRLLLSQKLSAPDRGLIPQIPNYFDFNMPLEGITASSAAQDVSLGFDTSLGVANEEDVEQVDYLGSKPNKVQTGIAKLFEFLQRFSPVANIARGIESIRNRFDTRKAIQRDIQRDTQGGPITTFRNLKQQAQDKIDDRGRGQIPSRTTSAPTKSFSKSYSDAKSAFTAGRR